MSLFVKKVLGLLSFIGTIPWVLFCIGRILFLLIRHGPTKFFERKEHDPLPKVAQNPKFEHDFVRTKSGMRFHCVHAGPRKAKLMLCLHGFPECWYTYHHVLNEFSEEYHVVAFDMRGYGDSDKPQKISDYHRDYLANDVKEIIHALGYEKAILVAHNWGGIVTWYFAQVFPECVDRMIIMNCPHVAAFWDYTLDHPMQFLRLWYVFLFQCPYLPELMMSALDYIMLPRTYDGMPHGILNDGRKLTKEEMGIFKYHVGRNFTYACNYYRAANPLYNGLRLKKKKEIITQPTLVVWGMKDHVLGSAYLPYLSGAVENLTVKKIEDSSHWVALDKPDVLAEEMRSFLRSS